MGWGGVGIGYVRPVQILDHLTVIIIQLSNFLIASIIMQISYYLLKDSGAGAKHCAELFQLLRIEPGEDCSH